MLDSIIKYKKFTADDDDASGVKLGPGTLIHGVIAQTTTLTAAADVTVHDALTVSASVPILVVAANTPDGTNFEETFGVMFPYPVKCTTGVSVDVTNCVCWLYYS